MAKPAYSLVYAILIAAGLLALVLFNRLLSSEEAAPATQASLQRNEATVREARDAAAEGSEKAEAAEAPAAKVGVQSSGPAAEGKDDEERK